MFYESVVASAIFYAVACWGSRLRVAAANRLNRLIRKASDIVGVKLDPLTVVSDRRMLHKVKAILDNESNPLHDVLVKHRSSFSTRLIKPRRTRVPQEIIPACGHQPVQLLILREQNSYYFSFLY